MRQPPTTDGFTENGAPIGPHGIPFPTVPSRGGAAYRIKKRVLVDTNANGVASVVPVRASGVDTERI